MIPKKIFTLQRISLITLLFGPIAGSFLVASNFKELGERKLARRTIIIIVLFTFLLFALLFSITDNFINNLASLSIPAIYTAIIAFVSNNLQNNQIKEYLEKGGQTASTLSAVGLGFSGLLFAIGLLIGVAFLDGIFKYDKIEIEPGKFILYKRDVPHTNSKRLSTIIKDSGYLEGADQVEIYLALENDKYQLSFILTDPSVLNDTSFTSDMRTFQKFLNYNGNLDKPLEINFMDQFLTNKYNLPVVEKEVEPYEFLQYLFVFQISDNHRIFHDITVPQKDLNVIAESVKKLKGYFPPEELVDFIFLNYEDFYSIKIFMPRDLWRSKPLTDRIKSTVDYFQKNGIAKPIKIFPIDPTLYSETQI